MSRSNRGGGALEFAIGAPLLLAFVLAIVDLGRFVTDAQRATSAASAAADLASQVERFTAEMNPELVVTGEEVAVLPVAAREVAKPLDLLRDGALIVTVVANQGAGAAVSWTRRWGRSDVVSRVGVASLHGIVLANGEGAVFAEVTYRFRPYLLSGRLFGLRDGWEFRTSAVRRPRLAGPEIAA